MHVSLSKYLEHFIDNIWDYVVKPSLGDPDGVLHRDYRTNRNEVRCPTHPRFLGLYHYHIGGHILLSKQTFAYFHNVSCFFPQVDECPLQTQNQTKATKASPPHQHSTKEGATTTRTSSPGLS